MIKISGAPHLIFGLKAFRNSGRLFRTTTPKNSNKNNKARKGTQQCTVHNDNDSETSGGK